MLARTLSLYYEKFKKIRKKQEQIKSNIYTLKIINILRTASLESNFTGSFWKECIDHLQFSVGIYFPNLILCKVRWILRINDFIPRATDLFSRMITQGGNRTTLTKQLRKTFHFHLILFQEFDKTHEEINISITRST